MSLPFVPQTEGCVVFFFASLVRVDRPAADCQLDLYPPGDAHPPLAPVSTPAPASAAPWLEAGGHGGDATRPQSYILLVRKYSWLGRKRTWTIITHRTYISK